MSNENVEPLQDLPTGVAGLDGTNRRLLELFGADPHLSTAALARQLGMSAPAVRERLARLRDTGVIRGVRLDVDPAALGLPVAAWVRIQPGPGQLSKLVALIDTISEISECHRISGKDCLLLKVHVSALDAIGDVLDRLLVHGRTTSSFIVSTPLKPRTPRPSR